MEDKTFALLENLYVEMMGLRTEFKEDIQGLRTDMARMEHDNAQKFGALFDGLSANTEAIHELKGEVQALKKEVENHEIKLKLVK
jgi:archaellum component FlaC